MALLAIWPRSSRVCDARYAEDVWPAREYTNPSTATCQHTSLFVAGTDVGSDHRHTISTTNSICKIGHMYFAPPEHINA
ncbi:hypothetical protein [Mycobacterium]|uniref:Uncharacterized protein n=1 Tax=Mycobacterium asiaticum TaxID=1790 RepID=A0A1A3DJG7_MYCAS|nr:hypothetical protein [Mycobacterium]OBI98922.1 hypothetical protein A5661_13150 [Mycobacterium asiaticum]OBJ87792.1 hypothetical protein A5640_06165 [Mycobacterium asiaticum]